MDGGYGGVVGAYGEVWIECGGGSGGVSGSFEERGEERSVGRDILFEA